MKNCQDNPKTYEKKHYYEDHLQKALPGARPGLAWPLASFQAADAET
jgi:hypothetical protein